MNTSTHSKNDDCERAAAGRRARNHVHVHIHLPFWTTDDIKSLTKFTDYIVKSFSPTTSWARVTSSDP